MICHFSPGNAKIQKFTDIRPRKHLTSWLACLLACCEHLRPGDYRGLECLCLSAPKHALSGGSVGKPIIKTFDLIHNLRGSQISGKENCGNAKKSLFDISHRWTIAGFHRWASNGPSGPSQPNRKATCHLSPTVLLRLDKFLRHLSFVESLPLLALCLQSLKAK